MPKNEGNIGFRLSLLLGIVSRLVIAPFTGFDFDLEVLKFAARTYYEGSEIVLFTNWTNPPLLYYITLFAYSFYFLLQYLLGLPDVYLFAHGIGALEAIFLKLPFIIADLLIFIFLRRSFSVLGLEETESLTISNMYFLNPYVIFISAAHGMWDALASFFLVLGVFFLIKWHEHDAPQNIYYATLAFVASFGVKWIGLAPLFVLFTLLVARKAFLQIGKMILTSLAALFLLYLPFVFHGLDYLVQVIAFRVAGGSSPLWASNQFQFLYFLGVSPSVVHSLFVPMYLGFLFIMFLLTIYLQRKYENKYELQLFLIFTLALIIVFYILYYAPLPQLFVWFMALAPFFLALKEIDKEIRDRFQFYVLLFSVVITCMLLLVGKGVQVLFGGGSWTFSIRDIVSSPSNEGAGGSRLSFIYYLFVSTINLLRTMFFIYLLYLVGKGLVSILHKHDTG